MLHFTFLDGGKRRSARPIPRIAHLPACHHGHTSSLGETRLAMGKHACEARMDQRPRSTRMRGVQLIAFFHLGFGTVKLFIGPMKRKPGALFCDFFGVTDCSEVIRKGCLFGGRKRSVDVLRRLHHLRPRKAPQGSFLRGGECDGDVLPTKTGIRLRRDSPAVQNGLAVRGLGGYVGGAGNSAVR
jgi:hypothetical protein